MSTNDISSNPGLSKHFRPKIAKICDFGQHRKVDKAKTVIFDPPLTTPTPSK